MSRIASLTSGFSTTATFLSLARAVESLSTPSSVRGETKVVSLLLRASLRISQYAPTMYSVSSSGTTGWYVLHRAM